MRTRDELLVLQTSRSGFSLLEAAISVTVIGLLAVGILQIVAAFTENQAIRVTEDRLDLIEEALVLYASRNGYLPCPADATPATDADDGVAQVAAGASDNEDCAAINTASGDDFVAVPWRELGIGRQQVRDGWGNRITYAVYDDDDGDTEVEGVTRGVTSGNEGLDMLSCSCPGPECDPENVDAPIDPNSPWTLDSRWTLGTGWDEDSVGREIDHDALSGSTDALTLSPFNGLSAGNRFNITLKIDDPDDNSPLQGSISVEIGSPPQIALSLSGLKASVEASFVASSTSNDLTITPTSDFNGSISGLVLEWPHGDNPSLTLPDCAIAEDSDNVNEFLRDKGLTVLTDAQDPNSAFLVPADGTGAAYVLISHGQNGAGAYASSARTPLPAATRANELANVTFDNSYVDTVHSNVEATYYDDHVRAARIDALARRAGWYLAD